MLGELNTLWENRYNHTLTGALPRVAPQFDLTKKEMSGENVTITHLAEEESLSSYRRKQLSMSFEQRPVKKAKLHSLSQENQTWNHEGGLALLHAHPPNKNVQTARNLHSPNKNAGQVLKEFAMQQGFNISAMECQNETPPSRHKK